MYFKPPQNNMTSPFYHPLNRQPVQEAVTVELDFKSDAEGKKAGGKMVRKGVYRMTFKNNAEMNKFMDTHADKLNEGTEELEEGTPAYRKMMKRYKGSDTEKVFNMLRAKGYKVGEQDDTLVQNLLKRHRGNVKKVVDQIVKDYPGKFDVERMMMDHVEIDEDVQLDEKVITFTFRKTEDAREFERKAFSLANSTDIMMMPGGKTGVEVSTMGPKDDKSLISLAKKMGGRVHKIVEDVQLDEMSAKQHYNKMVAQGKVGRGGRVVTPIDKKRFPNREREGLEGPFRNRKTGLVYYYDKRAGKYYDPLSDMYLEVSDVMENTASYDVDEYLAEGSE